MESQDLLQDPLQNPFCRPIVEVVNFTTDPIFIISLCDNAKNVDIVADFFEPNLSLEDLRPAFTQVKAIRTVLTHNIKSFLLKLSKTEIRGIVDIEEDYCYAYLMLDVRASAVEDWVATSDVKTLETYVKGRVFLSYTKIFDPKYANKLIFNMGEVNDFHYWENPLHLHLSITKAFTARRFNILTGAKLTDEELSNFIKNYVANKSKITGVKITSDVEPVLESLEPLESFIDEVMPSGPVTEVPDTMCELIKNHITGASTDKQIYFTVCKPHLREIEKSDVKILLLSHNVPLREKHHLISNLLISKQYADYILNDPEILDQVSDLIKSCNSFYRYVMGYAWVGFYLEESIKKTRTLKTSRYVFNLEAASKLPVYQFCHSKPHFNPYFSHQISREGELVDIYDCNIWGVKNPFVWQQGIITPEEFERRFKIFVGCSAANPNVCILDGIDWSNCAITGSMMAAILPQLNPLMMNFWTFDDKMQRKTFVPDDVLDKFFSTYYENADVDMACNHDNLLQYVKHVIAVKKHLVTQLGVTDHEIVITPHKSVAVNISISVLKKACARGEIEIPYDDIVNRKGDLDVKLFFYEKYLEEKRQANKQNVKILKEMCGSEINNPTYFEIINYAPISNFTLVISVEPLTEITGFRNPEQNDGLVTNWFSYDDNNEPIFKFSETLKYKIHSKHMKHDIELFRISENDFFSCVARFHVPAVRSYFDGKTCHMLPSAITAYMTLTNIDFKYFVGAYDPICILDKYRSRGYGTILNKDEMKHYLSYIWDNEFLKKKYGLTTKDDLKKLLIPIHRTDPYFKPKIGYLDYDDKTSDQLPLVQHLAKRQPKYPQQFHEMTTIDTKGDLSLFPRWLIDTAFHLR
jgi:hypothetical protein